MAKKQAAWLVPTALGAVGLGIGYWFGKRQTTAPAHGALPAGQVQVLTGNERYAPNTNLLDRPTIVYLGSKRFVLRTALDKVAYTVAARIYHGFSGEPCRDWFSSSLAKQRAYVTNALHSVNGYGYNVDTIVGAISAQCGGYALATPVQPRPPTVTQYQPFDYPYVAKIVPRQYPVTSHPVQAVAPSYSGGIYDFMT